MQQGSFERMTPQHVSASTIATYNLQLASLVTNFPFISADYLLYMTHQAASKAGHVSDAYFALLL